MTPAQEKRHSRIREHKKFLKRGSTRRALGFKNNTARVGFRKSESTIKNDMSNKFVAEVRVIGDDLKKMYRAPPRIVPRREFVIAEDTGAGGPKATLEEL